MTMPRMGDDAPDFELQDDRGELVRLSDLRGKNVVLFFYPGADTPGCTKEACDFRDDYSDFTEKNTVLLGIGPNTVKEQARFKSKYDFQYTLLADPDHEVADAYGVWGEKTHFGKTYEGVNRTTFVIDATGKLSHVFENVKVEGHSAEVLAAL